eukprot:195905-Pelagomonas_calceolata.AAC.1
MVLTVRFWSRLLPVTLQIPIGTSCFKALWWKGLTALLSQCASFFFIDNPFKRCQQKPSWGIARQEAECSLFPPRAASAPLEECGGHSIIVDRRVMLLRLKAFDGDYLKIRHGLLQL